MKQLHARIVVPAYDPHESYLAHRRLRYGRRMELMGLRPASIEKYLKRGFPGPFARAMRREMARLIWDIRHAGR